jgi:hypothetical protein
MNNLNTHEATDYRDANSRYGRLFDAMNEFFLSIPNCIRANLDGDRGLAIWPADVNDILTRGAQYARTLGLEVKESNAGWSAMLPRPGQREDGTPARVEYEATHSTEWGPNPVCIVSYVADPD